MLNRKIRNDIKKFAGALAARNVHVAKLVVYGSYAKDTKHGESDLDLAVISADFGKDRFEEGKLLLQTAWRINPRLHPIPISIDSLENDTWIPLIHEIREHGIEISS